MWHDAPVVDGGSSMPLHVITGRATAGKTGEVNARLFASLARGESPVLVLPSVADARRASAELSEKAPAGIAVVTLSRWANGLWRLYGDGRRIVGDASREAFVRRAIAESPAPALGDVTGSPGFSAMISRTVRTMAGDPEDRVPNSDAMRGVAGICGRYRALLDAGGLIEAAEAWRTLGANPPILPGTVAINRFADVDEPALALLEGLSTRNEVVVALTWEDGFAPTRALAPTVQRLSARADTVTHVPDPAPAGELDELLAGLYSATMTVMSTGAVRMGLAAGNEAEAALVASYVAERIALGTRPERIVVAFPDVGLVENRLVAAFRAEGVEYDLDIARPVASTPLGCTLAGLLTLALGAGDRTTALGVLLGRQSDVALQATAELDRTWRKFRVTDPNRLLGDIARLGDSFLGRGAELVQMLARLPLDTETGKQWQTVINYLLSGAAQEAAAVTEGAVHLLAVDLAGDAGAARAVVRAIGEMASVDGTPFGAGDLRAALRTIVTGGTAGERSGRVQVTEMSRLRSRRFDTVVLGGLTAGEMSAGSSDSLADELRALFSPSVVSQEEDHARFGFYQALSRARHQIVLIRRESDDRGAPVRPSVLWEEVVDAYRAPGESVDAWPLAGPPLDRITAADIATSAPVFTRGRRELRLQASDGRCVVGAQIRGEITDPVVLDELAGVDVFSATEIEAYLDCPYRWFYERVVRPEEIDVEVDAREVGTIAHGLLKAFYDAVPETLKAKRVTRENLDSATRLLAQVIEQADPGVRAEGLAEELDLARAARWVEGAVVDDSTVLPGFMPSEHEFAFGGPGQATVLLGGVRFRGRIDRMDTSGDAVFVMDYKSSRQVSGHAKFAEEFKIQPIVYALAARDLAGTPVAGSVYRSLRSRRMRGFWRPDLLHGPLGLGDEDDAIGQQRFDELVSETGERVGVAVAGIRAGRIPREPSRKSSCAFCALRTQCEGATR